MGGLGRRRQCQRQHRGCERAGAAASARRSRRASPRWRASGPPTFAGPEPAGRGRPTAWRSTPCPPPPTGWWRPRRTGRRTRSSASCPTCGPEEDGQPLPHHHGGRPHRRGPGRVLPCAPGMEEGETPALSRAEAQARAETFLAALCGGRWKCPGHSMRTARPARRTGSPY